MYNKIMKFLDVHNILYRHQYGFRAKHSTIHPVLHLLNHCAEANNITPSQLTLATFCDLSKSFDTISTDILLHKLNVYSIIGTANKWIESYLTNRSQYVDFDSHASSSLPILGPLLFLLYINDISHSTTENILSFADDTTVSLSDSDPIRLFSRANKSLEAVFHWFCANRLSLNEKKKLNIRLYNRPLKNYITHLSKFLGITIDESLSWKQQVSSINSKI